MSSCGIHSSAGLAAARYGIGVGDVQQIVETAVGGMNLSTTVEGRARFPIRVRYARELRDNVEALGRVYIPTLGGERIRLAQVADLKVLDGPPMINSENSMLRATVLLQRAWARHGWFRRGSQGAS
jgi:Cu(I)/Ag(I) efflux system membrane protein CusA/SilA